MQVWPAIRGNTDRFDRSDVDLSHPRTPVRNNPVDMANGQIAPGANLASEPLIGNDPRAHPVKTEVKKESKSILRQGLSTFVNVGLKSLLR